MTISIDYGTMQRQIADELGDNQQLLTPLSDSTLTLSPIQNAIQQAIAKWEREEFYFNQLLIQTPLSGPYVWETSNGQEFYSESTTPNAWTTPDFSTVAYYKKIWVMVATNRYYLTFRTAEYMADIAVNASWSGQPVDISITAQMARLYPVPNGTYPIGIIGTKRFANLSADTDSNIWTTDAADLIRSEAKLQIARDVIYDAEAAQAAYVAIYGDANQPSDRGFLAALKGETTSRIARSKVVPSYF